ncbi:COQ9 family protein [Maricaulis sp. CAU 1757]
MTDTDPAAPSGYDSTRDPLLQAMLGHAVFDGWNAASFALACEDTGIAPGTALIACPRKELDLIAHWSRQLDAEADTVIRGADPAPTKIRDKVREAVLARLAVLEPHEEAARRARARLLLPDAVPEGARLLWASADMMWRAIGDTSTDGNFYSKRTILSGVYASTLAIWLGETDPAKPDARAFLDRRISDVMQFEKVKAQLRGVTGKLPDVAGLLGKFRYGPGPRV